jgi:hypothetical protein
MRYCFTPTLLFTVLLAGCGHDAPTAATTAIPLQPSAHTARSAAACTNVRGTAGLTFTGPNTNAGSIAGDLNGQIFGTVTGLEPHGQGAQHLFLTHGIVTAEGEVHTTDVAVLTPVDPPLYGVNARYSITGGTGAYLGASGFLRVHGQVDFAAGTVDLHYHGRICT